MTSYLGVNNGGNIPNNSVAGTTNGSTYTTDSFVAVAGSKLEFYFNFVTSIRRIRLSDGTEYSQVVTDAARGGRERLVGFLAGGAAARPAATHQSTGCRTRAASCRLARR